MKTCLTDMSKTMTIQLAGETDAGSAEAQPARDSRARATDGRRDDRINQSSLLPKYHSEPSYALKNLLAEGKVRN